MSAPKVDVKSFFQDLICFLERREDLAGFEIKQTEEVSAAVAELIEASAEYRRGTECHVRDCVYWHDRSIRMDVALARIGGAA